MFEEIAINSSENKIERMKKEINKLNSSIEDEKILLDNAEKSLQKLYRAHDNVNEVVENAFASIGFLKSSDYLKSIMKKTISGKEFYSAESEITKTKKDIEEQISDNQEGIRVLKDKIEQEKEKIKSLMNALAEEQ